MRLQTTYFGIFMLCCFLGSAQKVDYGSPFETEYQGYEPTILFEDERYLYGVDYNSPDILLQIFDKKKKSSKKRHIIPIPELKKVREKIIRFGFVGNKLVLFMEMDFYRDDRTKLYAYIIDAERGKIDDVITLVDKPYDRSSEKGYFQVKISRDTKSVVVNTATYYNDRDITDQLIMLLDENLESVEQREFNIRGKKIEVSTRTLIDNEGTIYFLAGDELVMLDPFNDFEEWREKIPAQDLAVNGVLKRLALNFRPDGNLVLTGFYETTDKEDQPDANLPRRDRKEGDTQIEGIKCLIFDPLNQEFISEKLTLFDQDFIDDFRFDDDKHDKHDGEINQDFSDIRFHFDNDGNSYLIAQPFFIQRTYDQNGSLTAEYYNYLELMVLGFDQDGGMLWGERVPLRQQYYWSGFLGFVFGSHGTTFITQPDAINGFFDYTSFIKGGQIIIAYNDMLLNRAGKNQDQELETYRKIKKGNPVVQEINLATGERKGSVLVKMAKPKMFLKPGLMHYSAMDDTFYYFLVYKKMMQLNSLKL